MSGKCSKALRQRIYGDLSLRNPRRYVRVNGSTLANAPDTPRARYQQAKRNGGNDADV